MIRQVAAGRSPTAQRQVHWHRRRIRGAEVLRGEGVGRLLARGAVQVRGLVYRSVVLIHRDLSQPVPAFASSLPVEFRPLEPGDADAWRRHRPDLEPARIDQRLSRLGRGDVCVAAWLDDEIVASVWFALEEARIPEIDRLVRLSPGEVFGYDSYTNENVRRYGIATARAVWTGKYLREAGYSVALGHMNRENRPAHGPAVRGGYRELGTAGYVKLGPVRRDYVQPAGLPRRWSRAEPIVVAVDFGLSPSRRRAELSATRPAAPRGGRGPTATRRP